MHFGCLAKGFSCLPIAFSISTLFPVEKLYIFSVFLLLLFTLHLLCLILISRCGSSSSTEDFQPRGNARIRISRISHVPEFVSFCSPITAFVCLTLGQRPRYTLRLPYQIIARRNRRAGQGSPHLQQQISFIEQIFL